MSASKQKGTAAEAAVVRFLRDHGFPGAERRTLTGSKDQGDIAGIVGVVLEVKNRSVINLAQFIDETLAEQAHAHAELGAAVVKRRMKSDPGDWYAVLTFAQLVTLLRLAGWGEPTVRSDHLERA